MKLIALPAFADNYVWMLHDGRRALVVDPGDAAPVHAALDSLGLALAAILVTHHHPDHVGGVDALRGRLDGPVYAPAGEATPQPHVGLREGDVARVDAMALAFDVLDVPGHTAGHIAYVLPAGADGGGQNDGHGRGEDTGRGPGDAPVLFCGDTLFSAGCGRLFEGTPAQMHASLAKLAALPGDTRVCCAHEYTVSNLRFAAAVEPGNADVAEHLERCNALRARGEFTLPSTIALERRINPFLRCDVPAVAVAASAAEPDPDRPDGVAIGDNPVSTLASLRRWKNRFR